MLSKKQKFQKQIKKAGKHFRKEFYPFHKSKLVNKVLSF